NMYDASRNTTVWEQRLDVEDWFGLIDSNGNPKDSYKALKTLFATLGDFGVTGRVTQGLPANVWVLELRNAAGKRGWVVWKQDEQLAGQSPVTVFAGWHAPVDVAFTNMEGGGGRAKAGDVFGIAQDPTYLVE